MTLAGRTLALVLLLATLPAFCQTGPAKKPQAKAEDMQGLIIHGPGFAFLANEPDDWNVDTGRTAREYGANAIFFPRALASRSRHVTIRVRLNRKTTEDPTEQLRVDMGEYKSKYPSTRFADFGAAHPGYKLAAKLFYTEKEFYDYVVYLNPGSQSGFVFTVSLAKEQEPATKDELNAFAHVLQSLQFVTGEVQKQQPR